MSVSNQQMATFFWVNPETQGEALFLQHVTHFLTAFTPLSDLMLTIVLSLWLWLWLLKCEQGHLHKLHPTSLVMDPEQEVDFCNILMLSMHQNFPKKKERKQCVENPSLLGGPNEPHLSTGVRVQLRDYPIQHASSMSPHNRALHVLCVFVCTQ